MIIDAHIHISLYEKNAKNLEDAFKLLLADMEKNGVSHALVIPDNIENSPGIADLEKALSLTAGYKNFSFLGSPQIIQRGSSETEKYAELIKSGAIKGLKFFPGHDPYYPTDERCKPYYGLCEKSGVPVLFHTGGNSGDLECAKWNDPKCIVEVAKEYPALKVIITHYCWPEMENCYEITKTVPNIYFEMAAMADEEVVEKSGGIEMVRKILRKTISDRPDKVMYGTDWPMCKMEDHIDLVRSLGLPNDIEDGIFYTNAKEIYNLNI